MVILIDRKALFHYILTPSYLLCRCIDFYGAKKLKQPKYQNTPVSVFWGGNIVVLHQHQFSCSSKSHTVTYVATDTVRNVQQLHRFTLITKVGLSHIRKATL